MDSEGKVCKQPEVNITITGGIHSGKTNIAALLSELLFNNNIAATVQCVDGDVANRMIDLRDSEKRLCILESLRKAKISIIDINGNGV